MLVLIHKHIHTGSKYPTNMLFRLKTKSLDAGGLQMNECRHRFQCKRPSKASTRLMTMHSPSSALRRHTRPPATHSYPASTHPALPLWIATWNPPSQSPVRAQLVPKCTPHTRHSNLNTYTVRACLHYTTIYRYHLLTCNMFRIPSSVKLF